MAFENLNGPIPYYLDIISKWPSSIAIGSQWFLTIPFKDILALKKSFIDNVRRYESGSSFESSWGIQDSVVKSLISDEYQQGHEFLACVFASKISIPSDGINASNAGLEYAGFQAPVTMSSRKPFGKLTVTFNETNASFVDFVIRPWMILVGHFGFVTRIDPQYNVKANKLDVIFMGKAGPYTKPIKRKLIRFYNIAPVSVGSYSDSYNSPSLQTISVDFVYDSYSIAAEDYNNMATGGNSSNSDTISPNSGENITEKSQVDISSNRELGGFKYTNTLYGADGSPIFETGTAVTKNNNGIVTTSGFSVVPAAPKFTYDPNYKNSMLVRK
jgi:hypothetical protein